MNTSEMLFVGIKKQVSAVHQGTGTIAWKTKLDASAFGDSFVNVFFDNGSLYANTTGMLFCLDPATGHVKWKNALPGCGYGIAALASVRSSSGNLAATRQMQLNKEAAADASVAS